MINGVSGDVKNYAAQGFLRFGTHAAASIRDSLYVQHGGSYQLQTRYALTGGSVNTIALYVNGANVATPNFTTTANYSTWTTNNQTINLNAGVNVIEFRATAAAGNSVYFDNIVIVPTNSTGNTIQENTTGYCSVDGTVDTNNAGYTGAGFANTNNAAGAGINWKVDFTTTGTKAFTFRYASVDNRPADLLINGARAAATIVFPSTGAWTTWNTITVYANTAAGISDVCLVATGPNGLPNIDYLQINGGTAANCATAVTTYSLQENETGFCSIDGTIDNNYLGFVGSGFANTNNAIGAGINWRVNAAAAGTKTFTFRYASTDSRPGRLLINGTTAIAGVAFPATGSWTTWSTVTVTASTPAGAVDIRLEATAATGLGNIDYLSVNATPAACPSTLLTPTNNPATLTATTTAETAKSNAPVQGIRLSPNPASNVVNVDLGTNWAPGDQLIVTDVTGKVVLQQRIGRNTATLHIAPLSAGNYFIKVFSNKAPRQIGQFIKQ